MKPSFAKNGLDGFTTDTVTCLFSNIGFTTDTDRFHYGYRQSHQRYRVLNLSPTKASSNCVRHFPLQLARALHYCFLRKSLIGWLPIVTRSRR